MTTSQKADMDRRRAAAWAEARRARAHGLIAAVPPPPFTAPQMPEVSNLAIVTLRRKEYQA